jgi:hypothetical protein
MVSFLAISPKKVIIVFGAFIGWALALSIVSKYFVRVNMQSYLTPLVILIAVLSYMAIIGLRYMSRGRE